MATQLGYSDFSSDENLLNSANNHNRNNRETGSIARKRRTIKRQNGGGALDSIMSMVPFVSSSGELSIPSDDYEESDQQSNQNVLVGALCNQYLKNNIRGTIKTEYDPVLDSLCSGVNISSNNTIPLNNLSSNSISLKKRSKKKPQAKLKQAIQSKNHSKTETETSSQSGGVKLPSFLGGVKGLANFYSLPIRTGIKAVNSGINSLKNYSKKKSEASSAKSESSSKETPSTNEIDDDIAKAEAEILKEKHADLEARDEVASNFSDNKNLDIKEVIKK